MPSAHNLMKLLAIIFNFMDSHCLIWNFYSSLLFTMRVAARLTSLVLLQSVYSDCVHDSLYVSFSSRLLADQWSWAMYGDVKLRCQNDEIDETENLSPTSQSICDAVVDDDINSNKKLIFIEIIYLIKNMYSHHIACSVRFRSDANAGMTLVSTNKRNDSFLNIRFGQRDAVRCTTAIHVTQPKLKHSNWKRSFWQRMAVQTDRRIRIEWQRALSIGAVRWYTAQRSFQLRSFFRQLINSSYNVMANAFRVVGANGYRTKSFLLLQGICQIM